MVNRRKGGTLRTNPTSSAQSTALESPRISSSQLPSGNRGLGDDSSPKSFTSQTFCFCNEERDDWIGCDGTNCRTLWYHLSCVGLSTLPSGSWYCRECTTPTESSTPIFAQPSFTAITETASSWLLDNVIVAEGSTLLKSDVRSRYQSFCQQQNCNCLNDASFGKIFKDIFPGATVRRLGGRQKSKYSYCNVTWKPSSEDQVEEDLGQLLSLLRGAVPTLRRCPRGARIQVAEAIAEAIDNVVQDNSESSWRDLFLLPYAILPVPEKSAHVTNLTSWVKHKTTTRHSLLSQNWLRILRLKTRMKFSDDASNIGKKIEAKLSDGDIRGAIRLLNSDDTIATDDDSTFTALQEKHPLHPSPTLYPDPPPLEDVQPFREEEIRKAVFSFPAGSAGGLDSLRPQILKDLIGIQTGDHGIRLLSAMEKLSNLLLRGEVPATISPILFGASLVALQKNCGGIRPIAIGCTWRRLVAKLVARRITPLLSDYLSPYQLGVGVKAGAEIGAHCSRIYFNYTHRTPKIFLKIDFRNAFNEIRRDSMLEQVKAFLPGYFPFVSQGYMKESFLYFNSRKILSERGVQQGDPLGPILFALTLHPIILQTKTELNLWYLDDGTIAGSSQNVLDAFNQIKESSEAIGLQINQKKCEFTVLGEDGPATSQARNLFSNCLPDIRAMKDNESTLLGAPLNDNSARNVLEQKTFDFQKMSSRLANLSSHSAFFLLRTSISTPRLIYFLRCYSSWRFDTEISHYDEALKLALERIVNCQLSPEAWSQSSLPVKLGGLGIRHASESALPCFLASFHSVRNSLSPYLTEEMINADESLVDGLQMWKQMDCGPTPETILGFQASWERPIFEKKTIELFTNATCLEDKARLLSAKNEYSGTWLSALPSRQLGTHLSDESFRISVGLRLGNTICEPHRCCCGASVDSKGRHGLSCKRSQGRHSKHAGANDIIHRALRSAGVPSILEPLGCMRDDGKRPDGLTLIPWKNGRAMLWDFTCIDTFAASYVSKTSQFSGSAASEAESRKKKKYATLIDRYNFIPIALETSGIWGIEGLQLLKTIGNRISEITGEKKSTSFLLQKLSFNLQRGNAASVLGTVPPGKDLYEVYYL